MDAISDMTAADVAFAEFIADCQKPPEKKRRGRPPLPPRPEPVFTDRQLEIAPAALASRTRKTNAGNAAEKSTT